jgi:putative RecB family exonuclease
MQPPAAWLAQGTAFHETIRAWEESGRSELFNPEKIFYRFYDFEIHNMKAIEPDLKKWLKAFTKGTEQDISERRERGKNQVLAYVEYCKQNPFDVKAIDDYTLGIEVEFEISLNGIPVKGAIDLITDEGYNKVGVVDAKTGNRESSNVQLGIYKVAVEKIFGWKVSKAGFYYAKDSKLVTLTGRDLARYTEDYVTELISSLDRGIQNKVFLPNAGSHCTMCPVKKYCREWN